MTTLNYKIPHSAQSDALNLTYLLTDAVRNATGGEAAGGGGGGAGGGGALPPDGGVEEGFEPYMPRAHFWTVKALTALLTLLGLSLNLLALVSILKFFYHFSASCRFVINLLLTDLLFSAVVLCRLALSLAPGVAHSRALCLGFFSGMLCTGSTVQLSLLLALLDNFVTVVFPLRYRNLLTRRAAHAAIAVIWVYSVGVMVVLPNLSAFNDWRPSSACDFNRVLTKPFRTLLAVQFGGVTTVLVGVYVRVLAVAAGHHRDMVRRGEHLSQEERERIRERCSNVQCKGLLVLCFFVCWLPVCLLQALDRLFTPEALTVLSGYATLFVVFNAAANPVVCVWRNAHFRLAVVSLLGLKDATQTINITVMSA